MNKTACTTLNTQIISRLEAIAEAEGTTAASVIRRCVNIALPGLEDGVKRNRATIATAIKNTWGKR